VSTSRQFVEAVNEIFEGAEAFLAREIDTLREREKKRRLQRNGNRQPPTGKPRGRPKLTAEAAAEAEQKRREYRRRWMRAKRSAPPRPSSALAALHC
jgi:hypothetical protein